MNESDDKFTQAVVEWKHKHRIQDDDPMLASLELLEIFFKNVRIQIPDSGTATIAEVRAAIQQLDHLALDFAKQVRELTVELRGAPAPKPHGHSRTTAWLILGLVVGVLVGKFLI
jgi:hypothetical protein